MADILSLIQRALSRDDNSHTAAAELVCMGPVAIEPIVDTIRIGTLRSILPLSNILARIMFRTSLEDCLSSLEPLIYDANIDVSLAVVQALGHSRQTCAFPVLETALAKMPIRTMIVNAIGELGDKRGIEILQLKARALVSDFTDPYALQLLVSRAREDGDSSDMIYLLHLSTSLAKLGNHDLAPIAIALSRYDRMEGEDPESDIVRIEAIESLNYVIGAGLYNALVDALHDRNPEIRESAMRAMLLLGAKQAAASWIELIHSGCDIHVMRLAYSYIYELTGEWAFGNKELEIQDLSSLSTWWEKTGKRFLTGTCYQRGKPSSPHILIRQIRERIGISLLNDIRIVTGHDFEIEVDPELVLAGNSNAIYQTAENWWAKEHARFDAGYLYKYGHRQQVMIAFDNP